MIEFESVVHQLLQGEVPEVSGDPVQQGLVVLRVLVHLLSVLTLILLGTKRRRSLVHTKQENHRCVSFACLQMPNEFHYTHLADDALLPQAPQVLGSELSSLSDDFDLSERCKADCFSALQVSCFLFT